METERYAVNVLLQASSSTYAGTLSGNTAFRALDGLDNLKIAVIQRVDGLKYTDGFTAID